MEFLLLYAKKELIEEFLDIFQMDRMHDNAPINSVLLKGDIKKELKNWVWKEIKEKNQQHLSFKFL